MTNTLARTLVRFIDHRLDSMLKRAPAWASSSVSLEEQTMLLLEIRIRVLHPDVAGQLYENMRRRYFEYLWAVVGRSNEPLATQLEKRGQADRFIPLLRDFVAVESESLPDDEA